MVSIRTLECTNRICHLVVGCFQITSQLESSQQSESLLRSDVQEYVYIFLNHSLKSAGCVGVE